MGIDYIDNLQGNSASAENHIDCFLSGKGIITQIKHVPRYNSIMFLDEVGFKWHSTKSGKTRLIPTPSLPSCFDYDIESQLIVTGFYNGLILVGFLER